MDIQTSDLDDISDIGKLDKQCGEVYLSTEGNISFLCTLCRMKYRGYQAYAEHIMEIHYSPNKDEDDESLHSIIDVQLEHPCDEIETVITSEEDIGSSRLENDFQLLEDIEFVAPVPNNCVEIEEFVASFQNTNDENKLDCIENGKMLKKLRQTKNMGSSHASAKTKTAISKAGRYRCSKCHFFTKHYGVVMNHIARHFGDKRHFCKICNRGFYVPSELRVHMRTHTGERPYLCTECGQTFKRSSALGRHAKRCKNIRDVECPECGKKFFDNRGLRDHIVIHSEQRSHQCMECDASFKLAKGLRNHIKIHENKKEFKCQYCPASFNQQPGLISHVKNRHRAKENIDE